MKTLLLLRHAKSSWDNPAAGDFDRPLNERGRQAAPRVGRFLAESGLLPDRVVCSPAQRTRETWAAVQGELDAPREASFDQTIYLGAPGTLLEVAKSQPDDADTVMLIGHNPGIEALAAWLAREGDAEALRRLSLKFPTAGLAVLEFGVDHWAEIDREPGSLKAFVRPSDLP